ncbi:hypothetical protein AGMMS50212_16920 [Spirochaetia bacterium]|nr:hypothetical protein AGMMS50212_16920 [Spirochaetia bacterium]
MTIAEMFGQSGVLVLLGMGVVFSFLAILIVCVSLMGKLIHRLGWDKEEAGASPAAAVTTTGAVFDGAVVSAITAAVKEYRKN